MSALATLRDLFTRKPRRPAAAPRRRRPVLRLEALEDRETPAIDLFVTLGGTLDANPLSAFVPAPYNGAKLARAELLVDTPNAGMNHGTIYRVSATDAYPWGSGAPNEFGPATAPLFNQNVIPGGQGFRYVNDGSGLGQTESIPCRFRFELQNWYTTFTWVRTDTLVIHIKAAEGAPTITSQPAGITMIASGEQTTLSVEATGVGPLRYQWYRGLTPNAGNPIPGATASTYTTPALTVGGQYMYWVKVTNDRGVANSLNATVQVNESTTTTAGSVTVKYNHRPQTVQLSATVTRLTPEWFGLADGAVTFSVPNVGSVGNTGFTAPTRGVATTTGALTVPGGTRPGVYPLTATYGGNIPLYLAGSSDSDETLTIVKADQTISGFGAFPTKTYGDARFTITGVSATSEPDAGPVIFTSLNPSVARVIGGNTIEIVSPGTTVIVASHPGNESWNPAPDVMQTLTVKKAPLIVRPNANQWKAYGSPLPLLRFTASGYVNGENISVFGGLLGTTATANSPIGHYPFTLGSLFTQNYTLSLAADAPTFEVRKGTATIRWSNPAAIAVGTPLGGVQLNAGADLFGTFVYSPPAGTVLPAGTHTLSVTFTPTDSVNFTGATASVTIDVVNPLTVQSVVVNGGASQRSRVTEITVAFDSVVTFPGDPVTAFRLVRTGPGIPAGGVGLAVDLSGSTATQTIARITFSGPFTEFGSLVDGRYTLRVRSSQTSALGLPLAGGDHVTALHRLYGDVTGEGTVNGADFNPFRVAFGAGVGTPNYRADLDYNGDGVINGADFNQFRTRFGLTLDL
jgi:hypothetical protein